MLEPCSWAHTSASSLWRADGSPKPSVAALEEFSGHDRIAASDKYEWIDIEPDEFYSNSRAHLIRLYGRYRMAGGLLLREPGE